MRLNLGSGRHPLDGYENLDRKQGQEAYPLDYPDDSADEIRASHILEHFGHRNVKDVLAEWVRVLKPGGTLKIAVPDYEQIARQYLDGANIPVQSYVMGGQTDGDDYHRSLFDAEALRECMEAAGLVDIRRWQSEADDCAALPISLNLCGIKSEAAGAPQTPIGEAVTAVMSLPRLAFTDNMFCSMQELLPLGIRLRRSSGVFWGQCLTEMFEQVADEYPFILTIDYDTVFSKQDVIALATLMGLNPQIDALCALQMKRECESPLFTMRSKSGEPLDCVTRAEMEADTIEIASGHFGLTLIRTEALKRLPRPWFHSMPGPDGRWQEGHMDEDVAFWHRWREAGNTLHQANKVVIGHLQMLVTWPSVNMGAMHQYVSDYAKDGKPEGVWPGEE